MYHVLSNATNNCHRRIEEHHKETPLFGFQSGGKLYPAPFFVVPATGYPIAPLSPATRPRAALTAAPSPTASAAPESPPEPCPVGTHRR